VNFDFYRTISYFYKKMFLYQRYIKGKMYLCVFKLSF
jgi:hypothetical protein